MTKQHDGDISYAAENDTTISHLRKSKVEEGRAAEVLWQQQPESRIVGAVQTVDQWHQQSAAVVAASARREQRRGIKIKAQQHHQQQSTAAAEQWWTKTQIFLIHFFPHKHMIYPILMESGILTATPFINVSHV